MSLHLGKTFLGSIEEEGGGTAGIARLFSVPWKLRASASSPKLLEPRQIEFSSGDGSDERTNAAADVCARYRGRSRVIKIAIIRVIGCDGLFTRLSFAATRLLAAETYLIFLWSLLFLESRDRKLPGSSRYEVVDRYCVPRDYL